MQLFCIKKVNYLVHQIYCLGMLRGNYWELLNRASEQDDLVS